MAPDETTEEALRATALRLRSYFFFFLSPATGNCTRDTVVRFVETLFRERSRSISPDLIRKVEYGISIKKRRVKHDEWVTYLFLFFFFKKWCATRWRATPGISYSADIFKPENHSGINSATKGNKTRRFISRALSRTLETTQVTRHRPIELVGRVPRRIIP